MSRALPLYVFFYFLLVVRLSAQSDQGLPFITNYSPEEYEAGTNNYSVVQDSRNVMYFANPVGVLEYDGDDWKTIYIDKDSRARSLTIDSLGRIYVGGQGEFGYLTPTSEGKLSYQSLTDLISEKDREFTDVWKSYSGTEGVFFQSFGKVFLYSDGKINTLYPENQFHLSFFVNDDFFILDREMGLKKYDGKELSLVPGGAFFGDKRIYGMLPYNEDNVLAITRENGIYLVNTSAKTDSTVRPFQTEIEEYLFKSQVYDAIPLNDTSYAIATLRGGVVVLSRSGKLITILNKTAGLQDQNIKCLFQDDQGSLWMGMDYGIARADLQMPLRFFNERSGLSGTVNDVIRYREKVYVATSQGLFRSAFPRIPSTLEQADEFLKYFEPVTGVNTQCWALLNFFGSEPDPEQLLVGTTDGVFSIGKDGNSRKIADYYTFSLQQSKQFPDTVFVGTYNGLATVKWNNGRWVDLGPYSGVEQEVRSLVEDDRGRLWMGIPYAGIGMINLTSSQPQVQFFDTTHNLDTRWDLVSVTDGKLLAATIDGLFRYNKEENTFYPEDKYGSIFADGSRQVFKFEEEDEKNYWMVTANMDGVAVYHSRLNGEPQYSDTLFRRIQAAIFNSIYSDSNRNYIWVCAPGEVYRLNRKDPVKVKSNFAALIREVRIGKDSIVFHGTNFKTNIKSDTVRVVSTDQPRELFSTFDYGFNTIAFKFSSTDYTDKEGKSYRWLLEGYDEDWSDWSGESRHHYTNLREGDYQFRVEARNVYRVISDEAVYHFSIPPPWYRTIWAYTGYFFILVLLIYGIVQLSIYRIKKQKALLEKIVDDRTREIKEKKEEIEVQKELVDEKNKDITDSINYASKIQNALLPLMDEIKRELPESFVLYKPRDIVSGDFYWFHKKGDDVFISAADCTGHGVPGAFMSMVGHTLLNEIVNEKNITDPARMLEELHNGVRRSLKQEQGESKDGMDMALLRINFNENELVYAGANNPLLLIRNGEILITKADKQAIGGYQSEEARKFTNHSLELQKNDGFYIFSDGYQDQFGGPKGKKFMIKRMKQMILEISDKDMSEQHKIMDDAINDWMKNTEQVDDILVIGIRT